MSPKLLQRLIIGLSLALCVGVVSLLAVNQYRKSVERDREGKGGVVGPTIFDQPLTLKPFTLTDQNGQPFDSKQLEGKVWVASFIYTRCPTVCPRVLAQTGAIQALLRQLPQWENIALVSITVDPEYDKPAVLAQAAQTFNADPDHWHFLTGDDTLSIISGKEGFRQAVGENTPGDAMAIFHSSKYVLVDQQHRIRGFYDALEGEARKELIRDVKRLFE